MPDPIATPTPTPPPSARSSKLVGALIGAVAALSIGGGDASTTDTADQV